MIRVPGEGMPEKKRSYKRGDLVIQVEVELPRVLTHDQKILVEERLK